jgi:transposase
MSDKKKRRPRREFDASFKADAVKLVQTGERPISLIAKELDITETSLRAWVRQAEIDAEAAQNGPLTSAEREELKALRARVKKLEVQQIILKKAAAFFAQDGK